MEPNTTEATAPKRLKTGGKKPLIIVGILVILAGAAYVGLCAYARSLDTFYPGYAINGVDVAGLTVQEAQETLEAATPEREIPLYGTDSWTEAEPRTPIATVTLADLGFSPEAVDASCATPFDQWAAHCMEEQQARGFFESGAEYLHCLAAKEERGFWLGYTLNGQALEQTLDRLEEQLNQEAVDGAYEVGENAISMTKARDGRRLDRSALRQALASAGSSPADAEESLGPTVEFTVLPARTLTAQEIYSACSGEVKNASYDAAAESIVPEQAGAEFDVDEAQAAMDAAEPGAVITIPAQVELPAVTAEELEQVLFRDLLGECTTHVSGTSARINNVKLSAAAIDGCVMNSGDVFSYNGVVGQRTAAKGYQAASAYVNGETVDEIGGGVCQTSSTLYYACLRSNLAITERYAHRYTPAYITWGMDATVSWGGPDYKFTNDTLYPIRIAASYAKGYLTVQIWGTKTDDITVKMTYETLSSTPFQEIREEDPTLAPGEEKVKTTPYTGYKVRSYRNLYGADGKLISSTYEATSDYKSRNRVILVGPQTEVSAGGEAEIPADPNDPAVPAEPAEPAEPQDPGAPAEPTEPADPEGDWTLQTPEDEAGEAPAGTEQSGTEGGAATGAPPQDAPAP